MEQAATTGSVCGPVKTTNGPEKQVAGDSGKKASQSPGSQLQKIAQMDFENWKVMCKSN